MPRWGRMESVRVNYDVPAQRGREVLWLGGKFPVAGRIISSTGSHLYVRANDGRRIGPLHPCWRIDYLDGRGDRTGQPTPMDRAWSTVAPQERQADER
jgi:hypothetical protein